MWAWSNGTSSYTNWFPGEPNDLGGTEFPFICERNPAPMGSSSGNTYLRINNPTGQEIASNNDAGSACGLLSNTSIVVPVTGSYVIHAGCQDNETCSGSVAFTY